MGLQRFFSSLNRNDRGFTLTELIVTMTIIGIALSLAAFSFTGFTNRNRANVAASELAAVLNLARSEAVTRGATVSACGSDFPEEANNITTPKPKCTTNTTNGWINGGLIFVDTDGDGVRDTNEVLLRTFPGFELVSAHGSANVANSITYGADGFANLPGAETIDTENLEGSVQIRISANGRVQIQ